MKALAEAPPSADQDIEKMRDAYAIHAMQEREQCVAAMRRSLRWWHFQ